MKKTLFYFIIGSLSLLEACKGSSDPAPDPQTAQLKLLSKTWKASDVTRDGVAQPGYGSFGLTILGTAGATNFGYTTSGRPPKSPWLGSGTWNFGTPMESTIVRDKGGANELTLTYTVSDTQLQLKFQFTGAGFDGSRVKNLDGQWTFNFVAQ